MCLLVVLRYNQHQGSKLFGDRSPCNCVVEEISVYAIDPILLHKEFMVYSCLSLGKRERGSIFPCVKIFEPVYTLLLFASSVVSCRATRVGHRTK